jgi:hypothetical protein
MRQADTKRDFIADTRKLEMTTVAVADMPADTDIAKLIDTPQITIDGDERFPINTNAHRQIGDRVGIPAKYYRKMVEGHAALLAKNVNHWFQQNPERRMIRTMDGTARAFLSERYRPLDNYDIAQRLLPKLQDAQAEVVSCQITDTKFYIKAFTDRVQGEVGVGDVVRAGAMISNSEVGRGSLQICPVIERLVCKNGMVVADAGMKKYHVGRGDDNGDGEFFRDATRQADDTAFWMKAEDTLTAVLEQKTFDRILDKFKEASQIEIGDPIKAVEVVAKKLNLTETENHDVLKHLVGGGDLSSWGLANAITRCAEDSEDYDRATEMEGMGWNVVTGDVSFAN